MASLIDDLLAFDDHEELLAFRFRFGGMLMWPFVRWQLYRRAVQGDLGWQKGHAESEQRTLRDRADYLVRAAISHPLTAGRRFDIVIFGSSAGVVLQRDGRWFDRINDYFAAEAPEKTLVVDASYRGKFKYPRFPPHVRCHDGLPLLAGAAARVASLDARDDAEISRLGDLLSQRFPAALSGDDQAHARGVLRYWAVRLPFLHWFYQRFFDRVRPRVVFVEDGSYGGLAHLLAWARTAGIATAEFQHGLLARSHLAYNYGQRLRACREFADYLPRHLLVYGTFWAQQVRTPAETVVVGCPHFATRRREVLGWPRPVTPRIVVLSQGDCTDRMVALALDLAGRFPERHVVFRLHPAEVPFVERYRRLRGVANVTISDSGDIYDCFREAGAVVGPSSTALFEAAGCGIPVFVDDDRATRTFMPPGFGVRFETAAELGAMLATPSPPQSSGGDFWAEDWHARYRAFLADVCGVG